MFEEVARIYAYFAENHAERIRSDIGFDPSRSRLDLEGMKRSMGLEGDVESLTHRELQRRRRQIEKKIDEAGGLSLREAAGSERGDS
jgi:ubiquinone biosynthesis protein